MKQGRCGTPPPERAARFAGRLGPGIGGAAFAAGAGRRSWAWPVARHEKRHIASAKVIASRETVGADVSCQVQ